MTQPRPRIFGLILAGGLARRMGGVDKALVPFEGRPLLAHVAERLAPQVEAVLLSANGAAERFAPFGLPVLPDPLPDHPGPLAGVLAGLEHLAREAPGVEWMVSVPVDTPRLPHDLVSRLLTGAGQHVPSLAHAASGGRTHPVVALWPVALRHELRAYLEAGERRVGQFLAAHATACISWDATPEDPFANLNTPEDLARQSGAILPEGEAWSRLRRI